MCFYLVRKTSDGRTANVIERRGGGPFRVPLKMLPGLTAPLGVSQSSYGSTEQLAKLNFAVISDRASEMSLCLYEIDENSGDLRPLYEVALDPALICTGTTWHVTIEDLPLDASKKLAYGWRCQGSLSWREGSR